MRQRSIEDLVVDFLERREQAPALGAEAFAADHPQQREQLLPAIRAALEADQLFPSDDALPEAPRRIGPYRVVATLGRGGMGVVYEVEREGVHHALKWLPLAPLLGPRGHERLRREAQLLARLDHPHIVRIREAGEHEGTPYLVMELVRGRPLVDAAAALDVRARLQLCILLCRAVDAAHEAGVVHRDLKPQNVMVRADGSPVLLDFGLGSAEELPTLTATGDLLGTPRYMAPEQIREGRSDRRTDVHALGLILYELLVGQPAFPEASREQVFAAIVRSRFRRPRRCRPELPAGLERVALMAMAFDPRQRFATAAAMAADLERFLAGDPVQARPPSAIARATQFVRVQPDRALVAGLAALFALAAVWWLTTPRPLTSSLQADLRSHYLQGVSHWLDGRTDDARVELQQVMASDPGHQGAAVLIADLDGGAATDLAGLEQGLAAVPRDELTAAVAGLLELERRQYSEAEQDLAAANAELPPTRRLAQALGDAQRGQRHHDAAEREYRRALALGPETAELWARLADVYLELENPDAGIAAAEASMRLAGKRSGRTRRTLVMLLNSRGDYDRAKVELAAMLQEDPRDANTHYLLGFAQDSQHDPACVASYRRAIELEPAHTRALLSLANVHAGANRGHCAGCDRLYAEHPEFYDPARAAELVCATLRSKAGGSRAAVLQLANIAAKLPDRSAVLKLLRERTAGKTKSADVLNHEWLLRRLEVSEPPVEDR